MAQSRVPHPCGFQSAAFSFIQSDVSASLGPLSSETLANLKKGRAALINRRTDGVIQGFEV
jgi:hypothetical protein